VLLTRNFKRICGVNPPEADEGFISLAFGVYEYSDLYSAALRCGSLLLNVSKIALYVNAMHEKGRP